MTNKTHMALSAARKLGIAMVATGVFTISGGLAAPQDVKAWGIGDVFDYVEDVWEIGADATERVGRAVGEKAKGIGRGTITSNNRPRRRVTGTPSEGGNSALPPARGTSRPSSSLPPARGTSSSNSRPSGNSALPPARGESSNNSRPSGNAALPPPRRPNETVPVPPGQRPTPITEEDVKPPFCNSKFENCSDSHGHHDHHGKKGKKGKTSKNGGLRDKSVWGNPVSFDKKVRKIKRNGKTFEVHHDGDKIIVKRPKRDQVKRSNKRDQMKRTNTRNQMKRTNTRNQMKRSNTRNTQIKRRNVKRVIRVKRNDRRG